MDSLAARQVDEYFNVHEPEREIGRGGQGVVYRTRDPDVAIKLVFDAAGRPLPHQSFVEKLQRVRALPVPPGLHLAMPMAFLRETSGYAMRLLGGMVPFSDFWPNLEKREDICKDIPQWLAGVPSAVAFELLWYRHSGGLKRRLGALHQVACILARLHGAGLVYGDLSPANAFVSEKADPVDVWLIDADNLRFETARGGTAIYTPGFGAPELVQARSGVRQRTDCHAFAVLAFWLLTLQHPFIGSMVEDGGAGDWADADAGVDADSQAYAGLLPWVLDRQDARNHKDTGLAAVVLHRRLLDLFDATFGDGRTRPWTRPSMFTWPRALARACDAVLGCTCGMSYNADFSDLCGGCPFCGTRPASVFEATAYVWDGTAPDRRSPVWQLAANWAPQLHMRALPHRLLYPFSVTEGESDILQLSCEGDDLRISLTESGAHSLALAVSGRQDGGGSFREFFGTISVPLDRAARGFWIRVGGSAPRVVHCRLVECMP